MKREYDDDKVLAPYLETFEQVARPGTADARVIVSAKARHV